MVNYIINPLILMVFTVLASCNNQKPQLQPEGRPNIVLIMADDMGFSDIGCYGGEVETPNLDRLADEGLRFTQFYNAARCCPTRASLLTGIYPHEAGVGGMVNPPRGHEDNLAYQGYLNNNCVTIAEVLKEAGYYTAMSGKWHVGEERPYWPTDRGFDNYYGLISGGMNYWDISRGKRPGIKRHFAIDSTEYLPPNEGFYLTDAITENAINFIEKAGEKNHPFFLYVAYTAPHWPLHAWPEDIARYRGKFLTGWDSLRLARFDRMVNMGILDKNWRLSARDPQVHPWDSLSDEKRDEMELLMAIYAAQIDRMDQGIGKILDQLDGTGATENTLVLFLADNGGCAEGGIWGQKFWEVQGEPGTADSYLSYGQSWANLSNTPFREYKHWVHEGGISTPLIARWPAKISVRGALTAQPGHIMDIMATCCELAETNYPSTYKGNEIIPMRGKSLVPIFKEEIGKPHDILFWEHEGNRAVRMGEWKIVSKKNQPWELYNVNADRTELSNLANDSTELLNRLVEEYLEWAMEINVIQ